MRLLPFSLFSMKLGVINSFLIVCFTMIQKKKYSGQKKITIFLQKYYVMAIKQYLGKCVTFTINTRENFQIIFLRFRSTKQFMIIR